VLLPVGVCVCASFYQVAVNRYPTLTHDQQSVLWANSETSYMDALGYVPGED